jgi:hypothetical protein
LRSPPVALSARNHSSADRLEEMVSGALHLPQKRLIGPLMWPHAMQTVRIGFPQVSQNAFVALLSLLQYRQSIRRTLHPIATDQDNAGNALLP